VVTGRFLSFTAAVLAASAAVSACGGQSYLSRADGGCNEQIVLSLAPGFGRTEKVMDELSRAAGVRLEYLRSASPTLHVFMLSARGRDPQCHDALARLRQDSHVRFAELDSRRMPHHAAQ
jgi:hypothetical protein